MFLSNMTHLIYCANGEFYFGIIIETHCQAVWEGIRTAQKKERSLSLYLQGSSDNFLTFFGSKDSLCHL